MNYLKELKTIEKVEQIKSSIDTLNLKLSGHSNGSIKDVFAQSFGENLFIFENLLKKQGIDLNDAAKVRTFVDELEEQLNKAKYIELSLAYQPDDSAKGDLVEWFHKNVAANLVLKLSYDPHIIAGTKITIDGKYLDYSAKKGLEDYFKKGALNA